MKKNVLIIGAGGVAQVVAHKCAQNNDVLGDINIASRTASKCDDIIASVHEKGAMKVDGVLKGHGVDATDSAAVAALIRETGSEIVINVGTAFRRRRIGLVATETARTRGRVSRTRRTFGIRVTRVSYRRVDAVPIRAIVNATISRAFIRIVTGGTPIGIGRLWTAILLVGG